MEALLRDWSGLPGPALITIARCLSQTDFLALFMTCKAWRSVAKDFWVDQAPLVALLEVAKFDNSIDFLPTQLYVYSVADDRLFKSSAGGGRAAGCLGSSHGYLILTLDLEQTKILLVNPLTGKDLEIPASPFSLNCATLTALPSVNDCRVLAFAKEKNVFLLTGPDCCGWGVLSYGNDVGEVTQMAFLDGKVYGLSRNDQLVVIDLAASPIKVTQLRHPSPTSYGHLAVGGQELFLLDLPFCRPAGAKATALRLNALRNEWVPVDSFGGRTMFMGYRGGIFGRLAGWSDQIFAVYPPHRLILNSAGRKFFTINKLCKLRNLFLAFWFLPNLCYY